MSLSLRVVTLNIHKGLSHFNRRMVIHELRDGLTALDPDVVFLQEVQGLNQRFTLRFRTCPVEPQHEFLAPADWQHAYGRNRVHHHGHYGNAILSRFQIVSTENEDVSDHRYERRGLLHCVVAVPGWRRNLHCVCVHLSLHERGRSRQLEAISGRLEELALRDVPIIIAGDFNCTPRSAPYRICRSTTPRLVSSSSAVSAWTAACCSESAVRSRWTSSWASFMSIGADPGFVGGTGSPRRS